MLIANVFRPREVSRCLPTATALRARSPLPIRVNRGRRCISLDAAVCALIGAGGYCSPARGRAPAGSGRFRRKRALISPWVLDFCAVFGGVVRRRLRRPGETPALGGVSGRFDLRNRPEVCRWGSRVARGARRHCGEQERGFRQAVSSGRYGADPYLTRIEEWEWHGGEEG